MFLSRIFGFNTRAKQRRLSPRGLYRDGKKKFWLYFDELFLRVFLFEMTNSEIALWKMIGMY